MEFGAPDAREQLRKHEPFVQDVPTHVIAKAALMRLADKTRWMPMTDCVGYCCAEERGMPFLTGDEQFKDLPNVEFVR